MSVQSGNPPSTDGRLDARSALLVFVVSVAALMAVIDGTIVTSSLARIGADLGTDLTVSVWFTSAYLLAAGVTMPLSGWIIERFGMRAVFLTALVLFVLGSLLCSLATTPAALIAFRVAQGLGGGLLEPTSLTVAAATAGPARMGRVMGAVSAAINLAPVAGPLLGGLLAGSGHWPWIFLINLPLGAAVLIGALLLIPRLEVDRPAVRRPDFAGLILLPAGFVLLLLAAERLGSTAPLQLAGLAVAGLLLLAAYVRRALTSTRQPVLDFRLLSNRGFRAGLLVMAAVGFTMYFQLVALALYAQDELGWSGAESGVMVAVLGVGLLVSMTLSGRASDRLGPRRIVVLAAALTSVVALLIGALHALVPVWVLLVAVLALGLSFGSVAAPSFSSVYRSVPGDQIAYATPALFVTVQLGAAIGASVAALLMALLTPGGALSGGYLTIVVLMALASAAARGLPGPASTD